jgi:cyclopropane fatty-acyl-phospholipid synthase-like methyltransferase
MRNSTPTEAYNEAKALQSLGSSSEAIYEMVARALRSRGISGGTLVDVGCGSGGLRPYVAHQFSRYIGVDLVKYDGFPLELEFYQVDLETQKLRCRHRLPTWQFPLKRSNTLKTLVRSFGNSRGS